MWECNECYAQVEESRRNRHRSWHQEQEQLLRRLKQRVQSLENALRR